LGENWRRLDVLVGRRTMLVLVREIFENSENCEIFRWFLSVKEKCSDDEAEISFRDAEWGRGADCEGSLKNFWGKLKENLEKSKRKIENWW
jgi:hypothetical protein